MFSAEFLDGPMEGTRMEFVGAEKPFADLYAIANPVGDDAPWVVVGYSGMEPDEPWPGQVRYHRRVDSRRSDRDPLAFYALWPTK